MPIDIDRFESGSEEDLRAEGRTNATEILSFLAANADSAYTPKEIHEATGVARGSVGVVLSRLADRGLVRHRGDYWAVAEDADAGKTLTALRAAETVTDRLGPEDPEEWSAESENRPEAEH